MRRGGLVFNLFCIYFYSPDVLGAAVKEKVVKTLVDWWCDETECYYDDALPPMEKCDGKHSIPYSFNNATGRCQLNIKGLFLAISNKLGEMAAEKNRKRTERIFHGVITSGKMFVGFATICACLGCFYCCWVQYSDHQLKKCVNELTKKLHSQSQSNKYNSKSSGKKDNEGVATIGKSEIVPGVQISVV